MFFLIYVENINIKLNQNTIWTDTFGQQAVAHFAKSLELGLGNTNLRRRTAAILNFDKI